MKKVVLFYICIFILIIVLFSIIWAMKTNTEFCHRVLATFFYEATNPITYKNDPIYLCEFYILGNGKTRFKYYDDNSDTFQHDTIETLLFQKLFSIDLSKLLTQ